MASCLLWLVGSVAAEAQAPQQFACQAVVRDAQQRLVANAAVGVRVSVVQGGTAGSVVYSETHTPTTNANGLFSLYVGSGHRESGSFASIDWGRGPYHVRLEIDPQGGTSYSILFEHQIVSVPYALYADSAMAAVHAHSSDTALYATALSVPYEERQVLSIGHDTIYLTGGSYVKLPLPTNVSAFDNDAHYLTDERQVLTLSNDTLYLTGGSYVVLPISTDGNGTHNIYHVTACDNYTWHGEVYPVSGKYTFTYSNLSGEYSVDTLVLTIHRGSHNVERQTATGSYMWHGSTYDATGIYEYAYTNGYGCASIDTLHLTINAAGGASCVANRAAADTAVITACGSATWYGQLVRQSGERQHSLGRISSQGCDSVVHVKFSIYPETRKDTSVRTTTVPVVWRGQQYSYPGDYRKEFTDQRGCDSVFTLHLMVGGSEGIGAANGLFSINSTQQVRFAHGDLRFLSMMNDWSFFHEQYETEGLTVSSSYSESYGDLFCWGATGYHDASDAGCTHYQPWDKTSVSQAIGTPAYDLNQYGWGPSTDRTDVNLVGSSKYYDWGEYHPISNGGNGQGLWRLLTKDEWEYILNGRPDAASLRGLATVNGRQGYILLADEWVAPAGVTFNSAATNYNYNSYTLEKWAKLEASGAVFLPGDYYWSSTASGSGGAWAFCRSLQGMGNDYARSVPHYVRLVQLHTAGVSDCQCTYFDTTVVADGSFSIAGNTYTQSGAYISTLANGQGCDSIITTTVILTEPGYIDSYFSVAEDRKVRFSKGNLRYLAKQDIWSFAPRQYSYVGEANKYITDQDANTHWIDLFGWATSGYHDPSDAGNTAYKPYSTGSGNGPSAVMAERSLVNGNRNYDWGVYNAIANGGNEPGLWRTLTKDEWYYLIYTRTDAAKKKGLATVNGVCGLVLLPDSWTLPENCTFTLGYAQGYLTNEYSDQKWQKMESAGAVFLPSGGYRGNSDYYNVYGYYWSSTFSSSTYAYCFYFRSTSNGVISSDYTFYRLSVRLVQ